MSLLATVVVATFGGADWRHLAHTRAIPSAQALGVTVVHAHAGTLAQARNAGLAKVETPWVVALDADDELEPGYLDAMATGTADVRAPSVRYVRGGVAQWPAMPRVPGHVHECGAECLPHGNWLVVGACVRTQLLRDAGGWEEFACYEDWALWLRCLKAGASFEQVPAAVYRAHVRPNSRNRSLSMAARNRVHRQIIDAVYPEGAPV